MTASIYSRINEVHIEITNMCNLSCEYCYAETILPGRGYKSSLFTNDLYRRTISRLFTESNSHDMDLVFHGGEPLLHSAEWFEEACEYATEVAETLGKSVEFSMQSNLTMLREAHIDVLSRFNVQIGVSLDGDKAIHDNIRGHFDRTMRNMRKLKEVGLLSGVIVVIGRHNFDHVSAMFQMFEQLNISRFHMNIASSVGRGADLERVGVERTWLAWKTCIDEMIARNGAIIDSRLISKIGQFLHPPSDDNQAFRQLRCDNVFCHAGTTMVAVQADGQVYPCGCAGSSGTMKTFAFDNINAETSCSASKHQAMLRRFHAKTSKYETECQICPARFVCEHGCPAFDHTDPVTPENTCKATKALYSYLSDLDWKTLKQLHSTATEGSD